MTDKCHNCQHFGGLNMDALPPHGGYWCWGEKRYILDTRVECPLFKAMVPEGATCTHPNMKDCSEGCPDCGLSWDEGLNAHNS